MATIFRSKYITAGGLAFLLLFLLACAFSFAFTSYSVSVFSGDGKIRDHGFLSFPRFLITFSEISLSRSSTHNYSFVGVPPARYVFGLRALDSMTGEVVSPSKLSRELGKHSYVVKILVMDDTGTEVYRCANDLEKWSLAITDDDMYYYYDGYDIQLGRSQRYTLVVEVAVNESDGGNITVEPFFAGGGIEMP